jgi:hypothetical protein
MGDARKPEEIIEGWFELREEKIKPRLRHLYHEHMDYSEFVVPLMATEYALSRVIESLILLDRFLFLKEQGIPYFLQP